MTMTLGQSHSQSEATGAGLRGPFPLTPDSIAEELVNGSPGAYALGYTDRFGRFVISYVGSGGEDLKAKLKGHVGTAPQFKFRHYADQKPAFEKECELFHQFRPSGNFLHPSRPHGADWTCPRCRK